MKQYYAPTTARFFIWRTCLIAFTTSFAHAQVAPSNSAADQSDQAIILPAFEVKDTSEAGYSTKESISALKTRQSLADLAGNVSVVTRELIDDINQTFSSGEALKFVVSGVAPFVRSEQIMIRGVRTGQSLVDDIADVAFTADQAGIDTYEVLKGPSAVLYGLGGSLFGMVVKTTKKPLPVFAGSINQSFGSDGYYRTDVDLTGPLKGGFSYRLIGAYQESDYFLNNWFDDRKVLFPTFQWRNDKTTLRVSYRYMNITQGVSEPTTFGGKETNFAFYKGRPSKSEGYNFPWASFSNVVNDLRFTAIHKFSENWQSKITAARNRTSRPYDYVYLSSINYETDMLTQGYLYYKELFDSQVFLNDNVGSYQIGPFPMQTNFGVTVGRGESYRETINSLPNFVTFNILNPGNVFAVTPRPTGRNNPRPRVKREGATELYYLLQSVDLLQKKLIINGGLSYINSDPTPGLQNNDTVKRAGIVFKPVPSTSLYYSYQTTFSPAGAAVDINGNTFPNVVGEGVEVGVKMSLFDDRLSFTTAVYELNRKDITQQAGIQNGIGYFEVVGDEESKGWELDLSARITESWSFTGAAWKGESKLASGVLRNNSMKESAGFWTKYEFKDLGLSIGGGTFFVGKRYFGTRSALGYSVTNLFASYRLKEWKLQVNIDNVFDKDYIGGGWSPNYVDYGPPLSGRFSLEYSF